MRKFNEKNNCLVKSIYGYSFKIYLNKNYFYRIKIFKNKEIMWKYHETKNQDWLALHIPYTRVYKNGIKFKYFKSKKEKLKNCVGEILLSEDNLGSSVITHEITHAVINFLIKFKNIDLIEQEEEFCYMVGDAISSIYNVLYENKII